jgi:4-carboxymuconolactone decarboxylase
MAESKSYQERHAFASETFKRVPIDPDLMPRQGALESMVYDIVGSMWSRPQLSRRDRSLLVISTLAAQVRDEELVAHTRIGLQHGLAPQEIEETLLHVAAYAGFPAALASSRRIGAGLASSPDAGELPPRTGVTQKSDEERDRDGADVLCTLAGSEPIDPAEGLRRYESMLGEVGVLTYRWALGEIWYRKELSRRDRSIVVISILVSLGATYDLAFHAAAGLRHGLSRLEVEEIANHLALYAGIPRAADAIRTMRAAFAQLDRT